MPSHFRKDPEFLPVPFPVLFDLPTPEFHIAFRQDEILAPFMPVPETAVHEDGGPVFPQDDVRMSGQAGTVDPVSVAAAEKKPPDKEFRFGIPSPDPRHASAALLLGHFVHGVSFIRDCCTSSAKLGKYHRSVPRIYMEKFVMKCSITVTAKPCRSLA